MFALAEGRGLDSRQRKIVSREARSRNTFESLEYHSNFPAGLIYDAVRYKQPTNFPDESTTASAPILFVRMSARASVSGVPISTK